jgi:hypothetical protein
MLNLTDDRLARFPSKQAKGIAVAQLMIGERTKAYRRVGSRFPWN